MAAWSKAQQSDFVRALQAWFEQNARAMSWRETRDPYCIWVSEVMLQQTRVETVERYFRPFIARFPDLSSLAQAREDEVLAAWSGLGYYRRARMLHRGARELHEAGQSQLPSDAEELKKIHGIGPYTAGAIASIAFDRPQALVDGNVARVSSRLQGIEDPKAQLASAKVHWEWVQTLMQHATPRIFAQALMELGATLCVPKNPRCEACPVRKFCQALATDRQTQIPAPKIKSPVLDQHYLALFFFDTRGRVLLQKRPDSGLLSDLWCFPLLPATAQSQGAVQLQTQLQAQLQVQLSELVPPSLRSAKCWSTAELWPDLKVQHVFSHRRWLLGGVGISARQKLPASLGPRYRWCEWEGSALTDLGGGVPSVTKKLLRAAIQYRSSSPSPKQGSLFKPAARPQT